MKIELVLPLPVTLNKLTHNSRTKNNGKGGRSKTKRAKNWERDARAAIQPFMAAHKAYCNHNITEKAKHWDFKSKSYRLGSLKKDHPALSYSVKYWFYFNDGIIRDIANYEKQLSDFLVANGFMLDDMFIDEMLLKRESSDLQNASVKISIEVLKK
ncbi:MAG: hypothetical protein ACPGQQ_02720 [Candidatus Puniceispirillaceae bacterium]